MRGLSDDDAGGIFSVLFLFGDGCTEKEMKQKRNDELAHDSQTPVDTHQDGQENQLSQAG